MPLNVLARLTRATAHRLQPSPAASDAAVAAPSAAAAVSAVSGAAADADADAPWEACGWYLSSLELARGAEAVELDLSLEEALDMAGEPAPSPRLAARPAWAALRRSPLERCMAAA